MNNFYKDKLVAVLKQNNVDAMLIAPSDEMEFILGHNTHICERFQALIIKSTGEYFYVCNMLTYDEIKAVVGKDINVYGWYDGDGYMETARKAFTENGLIGKTIGVNSSERAFIILDIIKELDINFVNGKPFLEAMRIIKTEDEIARFRKASSITDDTFAEIVKFVKPGMKEIDVINFIKAEFSKRGADFGFALIASGPNAALPHYGGSDRVIEVKDIVLCDFGCVFQGLCSDMTRTIFVGEATAEQRKMYEFVLRSIKAGEEKAVDGAYIPDVDKAAREIIDESGYGKTFVTRLGHGIGYSIHEAPDIKQSNKMYLAPGMTFSIEPGIYRVNEFGIRIEDLVLVTKGGNEIMNKASREIIIV